MDIIKFLYKGHIEWDPVSDEQPDDFNFQPHQLLEHFDQNPNSIPDDKFLYFECCDDMESAEEMLKDIKKIHDKYNIDYNKMIFVTSYHILDWDNRPSLIDKINYYELECLLTYCGLLEEDGYSSASGMFDNQKVISDNTKLCIKTMFKNSKPFVRQKHYLTYNGYMKSHRVELLGFLVEKDLLDKGLSSFFYYVENQLPREYIDGYLYNEIEDKTVISKIRKLVPYSFDNYRHGVEENESVAGFNIIAQFSTYFNIVTETRNGIQSHNHHEVFLSDKICKPLFSFQPFIVIGQWGSLEQLKRMGFKTFSPWINEEYDLLMDESDRMTAVLKEVENLCRLDIKDLHKWYWEMEDILVHNFNNFIKIQEQGPKKFIDFMENVIG